MSLAELRVRIQSKQARLGVIGLGYVGLPVACLFAQAGFDVLGVEIKPRRVEQINAGVSPIEGDEPGLTDLLGRVVSAGQLRATTEYRALRDCDVVTISVETPVDDDHQPCYDALRTVLAQLGPALKDGALVIVESTIAPGTIDRVVKPILERESSLKAHVSSATSQRVTPALSETEGPNPQPSFYLGHCPERVMSGKLLANVRGVSRVCGGMTPETAQVMVALYRHVVEADLDVADCLTAELVKTIENTYRDVQIAFANEMALLCEDLGADVWQVRELVNKSPHRDMHQPGAGVGGHCIPKDPWLLIANASDGFEPRLIPTARAVNDRMPLHVAHLTTEALAEAGVDIARAKVAVLGYAYLENSADTRNSPSRTLVSRLKEMGADVVIHDPWVADYDGDLCSRVKGSDALVVMVKHSQYIEMNLAAVKDALRHPVVIDGRSILERNRLDALGLIHRAVGR
jgi:UDP-N-acetyl-D-mannosaminuronic acid dehydrogenase